MQTTNTRDRILEAALRMFRTYGAKSITMNDISRECGMSKKTLYEHFEDKNELVQEAIAFMLNRHMEEMLACGESSKNAIEEMVFGLEHTEHMVKTVNPVLFYEIEKYFPSAWKMISDFKNHYLTNNITSNLKRGMQEGLYRGDLDIGIMTHMRLLQLDSAFNPQHFPAVAFDLHDVLYQVTEHYIHGIATLKGHKLVNKYLQKSEEE
ncbi:TetR family transcriptional regulator [Chitinophaga skermanii]|uniref:TetR family transcriptional regulator n=1 Tax=Chitinophaga skermanii TaxID=331697 RepID=A0A327QB89_9BACT|nr:TetR/AcrR family transcriptional regulator [Chitinophaga skermanii]RAJ01551.1 TetR family transcriptional regulator [Chitinophaga skermanii]